MPREPVIREPRGVRIEAAMKLVYDERFRNSDYADNNAALPGRMEAAMSGLRHDFRDIVAPTPATVEELLLAHDRAYIERIETDRPRFAMASLAAGGAILAARLAYSGEPAFACIRPPGHHASRATAWGHCTFNNLALALLALRSQKRIGSAFVIDIDQHTGDGTRRVLEPWPEAETFNPFAETAPAYLALVEQRLSSIRGADIVAVSAGFDAYRLDLGHKLDTGDFERIGKLLKKAAERLCGGRRFAVLEGGYYLADLGANVRAFCRGFA
jgi:acetoin utilization deacetylase AcuC-like enzyme